MIWIDAVYKAAEQKKYYLAGGILFDQFDDLHCEGDFKTSDRLIQEIDLSRLDSNLIVSLLSIVHPARKYLSNYENLVARCKIRLDELIPDRSDHLIKPFK